MMPLASGLSPQTQAALEKLIAQAQAGGAQAGGIQAGAGLADGQPQGKPLQRLREDLIVSQGPQSPSGEPAWLIYDPLRHRFIDIDQATFKILSLWRTVSTVEGLVGVVRATIDAGFDGSEAERLAAFLNAHALTSGGQSDDWQHLARMAAARPHGLAMTLMHNYLFIKIPLCSPQRFLEATKDSVAPLFRRRVQLVIAAFGLIGLYLASRQWDEFIGEARGLATLGGVAAFGATLFAVKAFHELGHA